ncbi:MAG: large subunit ribosomal protein L29 [Cognaticolwellia sp.]|mgnify:CR=1 FL=1|jgi:large subunit ribosomal protein L29|tara:strand:- start:1054 stop:1356 length:303 start_codon:yes stop_codon:yes gene_type:complete
MAQDKLQTAAFTAEELGEELRNAEANYQRLRFDHSTTGLDNPNTLVEVRRDIARLKTEVRKRHLAELSEEGIANRSKIKSRRRRQKVERSSAKRKLAKKK